MQRSLTLLMICEAPDMRKPATNSESSEGNGKDMLDTPDAEEDGTVGDSSVYTSSGAEDEWDINDSLGDITDGDNAETTNRGDTYGDDEGVGLAGDGDLEVPGDMFVDEDDEMVGDIRQWNDLAFYAPPPLG